MTTFRLSMPMKVDVQLATIEAFDVFVAEAEIEHIFEYIKKGKDGQVDQRWKYFIYEFATVVGVNYH